MSIKAVLFDLDGTLLPMDQDVFVGGYFKFLAKKLMPYGYDGKELLANVWDGVAAMVKNKTDKANEDVFWDRFVEIYGEGVLAHKAVFEDFYANDFEAAKQFCGYNELAREAVETAKAAGYRVALATNPIFPEVATRKRAKWAGFDLEEFELFTTYENCNNCKPNPDYFKEVAKRLGLDPAECLMVGNDAKEDLIAESIGMKVFLITDCLINKHDVDLSEANKGCFEDLIKFIKELA